MNSPATTPPDRTSAPSHSLQVTGDFDPARPTTELRLPDGRTVTLPTSLLTQASPAGASSATADPFSTQTSSLPAGDTIVIPLLEETLQIGRRTVATGTVRLHKTVQEFETALDEPLAVRTFDVERIVLNHPVDTAPPVRHEGETTVYPLVEEQLILTKQLILKEELRITRRDTERRDTQVVTLRREHLEIERESHEP